MQIGQQTHSPSGLTRLHDHNVRGELAEAAAAFPDATALSEAWHMCYIMLLSRAVSASAPLHIRAQAVVYDNLCITLQHTSRCLLPGSSELGAVQTRGLIKHSCLYSMQIEATTTAKSHWL